MSKHMDCYEFVMRRQFFGGPLDPTIRAPRNTHSSTDIDGEGRMSRDEIVSVGKAVNRFLGGKRFATKRVMETAPAWMSKGEFKGRAMELWKSEVRTLNGR